MDGLVAGVHDLDTGLSSAVMCPLSPAVASQVANHRRCCSQDQERIGLQRLPYDVLLHIASFLDVGGLTSLGLVRDSLACMRTPGTCSYDPLRHASPCTTSARRARCTADSQTISSAGVARSPSRASSAYPTSRQASSSAPCSRRRTTSLRGVCAGLDPLVADALPPPRRRRSTCAASARGSPSCRRPPARKSTGCPRSLLATLYAPRRAARSSVGMYAPTRASRNGSLRRSGSCGSVASSSSSRACTSRWRGCYRERE